MSSAAIFYHPEAYSTEGPKLMGRNAAGESFINGFFKYSTPSETLFAQVIAQSHAEQFAQRAKAFGRKEQVKAFSNHSLGLAEQAQVVYHPGPGIGEHAYQRRLFGDDKWSLCGITHTTSSAGAMDSIASLITAPVQHWDGLICTSTAVRHNVQIVLQAQADDMQQRLGATKLVMPKIPVIPLGIHTQDFDYSESQRTSAREYLSADSDTLVVVYMGRLSFHAKAHPLAMYQALQKASVDSGKKVVLVECGWHANDHIRDAFADAAKLVAPNVRVVTLDGREEVNRTTAWAGADVFCSLSDNIQETFGITPIEAMAAGIPVVVTDWDGYKDTVRHEVDGFRVPTLAPAPGLLGDLSHRHALGIDTYDMYCGHSSSFVAVDADALAASFTALFSSSSLRQRMGEAGRKRARTDYDWKTIIGRYEVFWSELNDTRLAAQSERQNTTEALSKQPDQNQQKPKRWPARLDPSVGFSSYPSGQLTVNTPLSLLLPLEDALQRLAELKTLRMVDYAKLVFPTDEEINQVLGAASETPRPASELLVDIDPARKPYVLRSLAWLAKLGILSFS
ncbi:glycosyltransferase family 4 protein [Gammaproteobacteria bacterium]|nr:glycosyltransferase family 4 protein [Gammaproteobacteria bacterium]